MDTVHTFADFALPANADSRVVGLLAAAKSELQTTTWCARTEFKDMQKIADQLEGGECALQSRYHPDIEGLNEQQQAKVRRMRHHVNMAEPALDRLVNSIHAGRITLKVAKNAELQSLLRKRGHRKAMAIFCESAFSFGTGYLVPLVSRGMNGRPRVKYWHPSPLWTIPVTNPLDITDLWGVVEMIRDSGNSRTIGLRFVGRGFEGTFMYATKELVLTETNLSFVPVVMAYGRDRRHMGKRLGKSLILAAADGSIRMTDNSLNLVILRDRQTRALLVMTGEPTSTSDDDRETAQGYLEFADKDGDAKFIQPESRLEQVIKVGERFCVDTSIATGLPLDAFRPELIAGNDASATAARQRAFPLQQKMVRLDSDWEETEALTAALIGALLDAPAMAGKSLEDIEEDLGISVNILPSIPEAEAETLSNWQQKTEKHFCQVEEAIEFYSGHLSDEAKGALAELWKKKFVPVLTSAEDAELAWKRKLVELLVGDATTGDVMANLMKLSAMVEQVGLPKQENYEEPWLPVIAETGEAVSGAVVKDADGDIVGGAVMKADEAGADAGETIPSEKELDNVGEDGRNEGAESGRGSNVGESGLDRDGGGAGGG